MFKIHTAHPAGFRSTAVGPADRKALDQRLSHVCKKQTAQFRFVKRAALPTNSDLAYYVCGNTMLIVRRLPAVSALTFAFCFSASSRTI